MALSTGAFQASASCDDTVNTSISCINTSIVSTPGRGSNVGTATKVTRRSLAELLQEDEARLEVLRTGGSR
jgi:hypothetical protein